MSESTMTPPELVVPARRSPSNATKVARPFLMAGIALILPAAMLMLCAQSIWAGSATWILNPATGDWNIAGNWTAGGPPNGAADTATFDFSNTTDVFLSANTEVNSIVFNSGASAFSITARPTFLLTISGTGITNNSGITQNFVAAVDGAGNVGVMLFRNSATAGTNTAFTSNGALGVAAPGGFTLFSDTSTAGNGAFNANGGTVSGAFGGIIGFHNSSTAGNGTFTTNGGAVSGAGSGRAELNNSSTAGNAVFTNNGSAVSGADGGRTEFNDSSTAGNSTVVNNGGTVSGAGGGHTLFANSSTAGNATLIANGGTGGGAGGTIAFVISSTGGTARVEVFGSGKLDISGNNAPSVTIGSIEGSGNVFVSDRNLTVGSNNLSTSFSGVIQDGGQFGGTGGSLTKIGTGTLSLTNSNTYSGGTLINAGTLIAAHDGALGSGNVSLTASGVTLTLQSGATNNYIFDNSSISIVTGATANLNFTGTSDLVGSIVLNGVTQTAPGTYGSASSGATFQSVFFSGTGTVILVPEPSTWAMMSLGVAMLAVMRLRQRRS